MLINFVLENSNDKLHAEEGLTTNGGSGETKEAEEKIEATLKQKQEIVANWINQ